MTFQELILQQKEFDGAHESTFSWSCPITQENLEALEFLLVALMGELGETSNLVKKLFGAIFPLRRKRLICQRSLRICLFT